MICLGERSYLRPGVTVSRDLNKEGGSSRADTEWDTQAAQQGKQVLVLLTLGLRALTHEITQWILREAKVGSRIWPHIEALSGCGTFTSHDLELKPQQGSAAITRAGPTQPGLHRLQDKVIEGHLRWGLCSTTEEARPSPKAKVLASKSHRPECPLKSHN